MRRILELREEAKKIIAAQTVISGEPKNLEEQAIMLVGSEVYRKFIKGYTEKQWRKPATELPAAIIRRLPVRFTYDNNYFFFNGQLCFLWCLLHIRIPK